MYHIWIWLHIGFIFSNQDVELFNTLYQVCSLSIQLFICNEIRKLREPKYFKVSISKQLYITNLFYLCIDYCGIVRIHGGSVFMIFMDNLFPNLSPRQKFWNKYLSYRNWKTTIEEMTSPETPQKITKVGPTNLNDCTVYVCICDEFKRYSGDIYSVNIEKNFIRDFRDCVTNIDLCFCMPGTNIRFHKHSNNKFLHLSKQVCYAFKFTKSRIIIDIILFNKQL